MSRNNQNFKRIRSAFELTRDEIVEVMALAGQEISKSKADAWQRGEGTRKMSGTGKSHTQMRMVVMTDDEFDAFCEGLAQWSRKTP
jgi:uncharacterized protein YehS (DUF1456 family)